MVTNDPSKKQMRKYYPSFEFEGNLMKHVSPFKILRKNFCEFDNVIVSKQMNLDEVIYKLGNDIDIKLLIQNHNAYYQGHGIEQINEQNLDTTLLISMIRQIMCSKCRNQDTNIWCQKCGIWSHSVCQFVTDENAMTFICKACKSTN